MKGQTWPRRQIARVWSPYAGRLPSPRSLRHLGQLVDDHLADELARVATMDQVRLGLAAASAALERGALLTRDPALAAQRLAAAAEDAFVSGDIARTRPWWTGC